MTGIEGAAAGAALGAAKKALSHDSETTKQLLRAAEGTPEMIAAGRAKAQRALVVERVKLRVLQPFARMIGVSGDYFRDNFPEDLAAKTAHIPDENLATPLASVAVPAMLGLSYSHDENELKDLYLNLLATAVDDRRLDDAHPAFVEVIKQLTAVETKPLNDLLSGKETSAALLKSYSDDLSFSIRYTHLTSYTDDAGKALEEPRMPIWVDNWIRLGVVEATYLEHHAGPNAYDWVKTRPEYIRISKQPEITDLRFDKGLIRVTSFGECFFRAVSSPV